MMAAEANTSMRSLLERWLPRPLSTEFKEVKNSRRKLANLTEGIFCDLYKIDTEPAGLPVVVRTLKVEQIPRVLDNEKQGFEALKKVKHRNIVQLLRASVSNNSCELFLEEIDGFTVKQRIAEHGPFDEVKIHRFFRQIASALCYLHSHPRGPIIHRDIRCENIMINHSGLIKLIDFGFALPSGSVTTQTHELVGTLRHMAPEIIIEEEIKYSRSSDMWAAGCALYAMAIGSNPYVSNHLGGIIIEIMGPVPEIQPERAPQKFSAELVQLYQQCMMKDPSERITATGMLLHPFLTRSASFYNSILLLEEIYEWAENVPIVIEALNKMIKLINESSKKTTAAKVATTATAIAGGVMAIVGFALLIPSLGAALPLAIAGTAVAVTGGTSSAAADIAGRVIQGKEAERAIAMIAGFNNSTEQLLFKQLESICSSVQLHIDESNSVVDLDQSRNLLGEVKADVEGMICELDKCGLLKMMRDQFKREDGQVNPVDEMIRRISEPIDTVIRNLQVAEKMLASRTKHQYVTLDFNRQLQKATSFFTKMLRTLWFGTADKDLNIYADQIKGALRVAAGGTQVALELAGVAGRAVVGRVLGIVGSAVFTVVDIGFLAKYSVELHQARQGGHAEKARPIACQVEICQKLLKEAADLSA